MRAAAGRIAAILKALELGTSQSELRAKLWENAEYFHAQLDKLGFDTGASTTYVMPIVIGDRELMYRLGHELRRRSLGCAVDYPAVPQNRSVSARVSQPNTPARIWMRR
jgi:7-keto-8-aminopelargonate synthetase and related enzymes